MPYGDGTGPAGMGPRSGRGMGPCAGSTATGYANYGLGMGFGHGRRSGRGFGCRAANYSQPGYRGSFRAGRRFFAAGPVNEKEILAAQAGFLEENLTAIKKRLEALEKNENE